MMLQTSCSPYDERSSGTDSENTVTEQPRSKNTAVIGRGAIAAAPVLCASAFRAATAEPLRRLSIVVWGALALVALLASPAAAAQAAPVFKCTDARGATLYTDEPCNGGRQVDIRPGSADPAAVARLERAQESLDRAAELRAIEARDAAHREALALREARMAEAEGPPAYDTTAPDYYYYAAPYRYPSVRPHKPRPHRPHTADRPRSVVPARVK
jgi:hypothetical protein